MFRLSMKQVIMSNLGPYLCFQFSKHFTVSKCHIYNCIRFSVRKTCFRNIMAAFLLTSLSVLNQEKHRPAESFTWYLTGVKSVRFRSSPFSGGTPETSEVFSCIDNPFIALSPFGQNTVKSPISSPKDKIHKFYSVYFKIPSLIFHSLVFCSYVYCISILYQGSYILKRTSQNQETFRKKKSNVSPSCLKPWVCPSYLCVQREEEVRRRPP